MTGQQMIDLLGLRLGDPGGEEYTTTLRLEALNKSQLRLASLVQDAYLTELEHRQQNVTVTSGAVSFTTLETAASNVVLNSRIQKVKIYGGVFADMITIAQLNEISDNSYLTASSTTPYSWVHSESIYVLPANTAAIDIYYLREPTALAADSTECELANSLHETVVDLAQAFIDSESAGERKAIEYIKALGGN